MAVRPPGFDPLTETVDGSPVDETAPPQKSPLRGALPFAPSRPRPALEGSSGEETAPPQKSPLAAALPFRHERPGAPTTAFAMPTPEDLRRLAPGAEPASAAKNTSSEQHAGLTIEQYASLCAELAVFPEAAEATFARYGLAAPQDRAAADRAWQGRLRADDALMQRWQGLYLQYHEHHSRTGR